MKGLLYTAVFAYLLFSTSAQLYQLYKHPADSPAKCIDGSPSALYVSMGIQSHVLMYFEGGGMCYGMTLSDTIDNCYLRSKTEFGSSLNYTVTKDLTSFTIMSNSISNNPLYWNWTKVYIPYCDGVLHQGTKDAAIDYKGTKLYLRGMNNTLAHFNYLDMKYGLFSAERVVISGTSAGAMAALGWANHIYRQLKIPHGLKVIFDSGQFVSDFFNPFTNSTPGIDQYKPIKAIAFIQQSPPFTECLRAESREDCDKFGVLINYISAPVFAIQSQYDVYAIKNILMLKCPQMLFPASLQKCNQTEMKVIEEYRQKSLDSYKNLTKYPKNSIWAISCSQHGFLYYNPFYETSAYVAPVKTGKTILDALIEFESSSSPTSFIDSVAWPQNQACSAIGASGLKRISLHDQ